MVKTRADILAPGDVVELTVVFRDGAGTPTDLDAIPSIQLIESTSVIYKDYGSGGVYKLATGTYGYQFTVPLTGPIGVWIDNWAGIMSGTPVNGTFNFVVLAQNVPTAYEDGYAQLGDEPYLNLSQQAIININRLMKILRMRLQSSGRHATTDGYGSTIYENCDIFSVDELHSFLCASLSEFNNTPHFTAFTWEDSMIPDYFGDIIVEGAYIMALASKALIEKGKEYNVTDNGVSFQPPMVADLLNSQMSTLLGLYRDRLKMVKYQMKPSPLGLGTLRISAVAPQFLRLRHRRERQFL